MTQPLILYVKDGQIFTVTTDHNKDVYKQVRELHDNDEFDLYDTRVYVTEVRDDKIVMHEVSLDDAGL